MLMRRFDLWQRSSPNSGTARRLRAISLAAAATLTVSIDRSRGATFSWDGGGANAQWTTADNWDTNSVPPAGSDVVFATGFGSGTPITLPSPQSVNSLTINTTTGFSIGGSALTLSGGTLTRQDVAGVEAPQALSSTLVLGADGIFDINGSGELLVTSLSETGGSRSLTKTGSGRLALLVNSTYTGATNINSGTLRVASGTGMGSGNVSVASGATLELTGAGALAQTVHLSGAGDGGLGAVNNVVGNSSLAGVFLDGNTTLRVASGSLHITFINDVAGSFSLTKTGLGDVVLINNNAYDGGTTIAEGQLGVMNAGALGSGAIAPIGSGASLKLLSAINFAKNVTLSGGALRAASTPTFSGVLTLASSSNVDVDSSSVLRISGTITDGAGTAALNKTGLGVLALEGAGSYDGGTNVTQGILRIAAAAALPGGGSRVVSSGAALELQGAGGMNVPHSISIAGFGPNAIQQGAIFSSSGAVFTPGTTDTYSGSITMMADAGVGALPGSVLVVSAPITGGFALSTFDSGTVLLTSNSNSFSSLTTNDSTLKVSSASQIPAAAPITVRNLRYASGGTLSLLGGVAMNNPLTLMGDSQVLGKLDNESGSNTWAGAVTLLSDTQISSRAGSLLISGNISGGSFTLTKTGAAELVLSGSNGFGDTSVNQGTLTVRSSSALPAGRTVTVLSGAMLQLRNNITTSSSADLRLSGTGLASQGALFNADGNNTFAGGVTLTSAASVGAAANTTLTLSNVVSDVSPLTLTKVGLGTVVLSGANTYRGGTVINGGTLAVSSDSNLGDAGGAVTLSNGAKLTVTANTTTARTFNLGTGSVQVNANSTLTYSGATINAGFLRGPGTHLMTGSSVVGGATALAGTNLLQSGTIVLNNFTNSGNFTSDAPLTWDGGYNTAGGLLTVNSTLSTTSFENNGTITINSAASLSNTGNNLVSGGGSIVTINAGGTLALSSLSLDLHGALAVNNGSISGGVTNVYFGSLLAGTGSFGTVVLHPGGAYTPGSSLSAMPAPAPVSSALITPLDPNQLSAAPILLSADTTAIVDASDNLLTLGGSVTGIGKVLTKTSGGTLALASLRAGGLKVNGGVVKMLPNGTASGMPVLDTLAVDSGAALDLTDNDLIVNNGVFSAIHAKMVEGYSAGGGGVTGIISSTRDTSQILALFDNAFVGATHWQGEPIAPGAIVGKFTYFGDVNIDGQVTGDDYTVIDAGLNTDPAPGVEWLSGDANVDGIVTGDDYTVIDANLGLGVGNPLVISAVDFGGLSGAVPEPTGYLVVGGISLASVLASRRRRSMAPVSVIA